MPDTQSIERAPPEPSDGAEFAARQIFDTPPPAIRILCESLGVDPERAVDGLAALASAGWFIAPAEPTNAMLAAYAEATATSSKPIVLAAAFAKARKRWRAMGLAGTKVAFLKTRTG